ncbi:MAG: LytTR family transcriptional regulator DNA-binding domain-containing protein [Ignavibacteriae bacterium]|nr:LytTR family transcriptional regulator DNA-binding domain-containing protein [Ignavibacteriota bacterium]
MTYKSIRFLILGFLVFILNFSGYAQPQSPNDQEVNRLNTLLRKHARNTDSLTFYANELLKYSKQNNIKFWEHSAYIELGNSERISGNIKASNDYYHSALRIATSIPNVKAQYRVMNNIALNHKRLKRNDSAYYYFKKLNDYHTGQLEILPASMAKMNIGLTFLQYQELDSAEYYLNKSHKGFEEINNIRYVAQNLNLLGELQLQKGAYEKALEYADSSLKKASENNLEFLLPTNYFLLSRIYSNMGNDEKAKEYSDLAISARPKEMDFSESRIDYLNEGIRINKAKAYESHLIKVEESNQFFKSNLFIAVILILLLISIVYVFFKKHKVIKNEFKDIQLKLDATSNSKPKDKLEDEKVIHLKSKATINSAKILYVKSDGHYVEYYLDARKNPEVDRNTMIDVEKTLPTQSFVRIHKSYIVNINRIKIINSNKVMLDTGEWINLSRVYKQALKDILIKE